MSSNSSNNNSFLNAFGSGGGRETPQPLETDYPNLGVPTNVPYVQPPNVMQSPQNIALQQKFSLLGQLGEALGTGGVQLGGLAREAQARMEKKRAQEQNKQYSEGLIDATKRASKTRDIYTDLTQNGMMPSSKNPYYQLGLQTGLYQQLSTQYRRDLVETRSKNPTMDPLELQDQVKQKYQGLLNMGRPEVVNKFFIEPGAAADLDDEKFYDQAQSKEVKAKISDNLTGSSYNTLKADLVLYKEGKADVATVQGNFKRAFEQQLATYTATGVPYRDAVKDAIDTVQGVAQEQSDLKDQMMVLDSLKNIVQPDGRALMSNPDYSTKYQAARNELHKNYWQAKQLEANTLNEEQKVRTAERISELYKDFNDNSVGPANQYTQAAAGGLNYDEVLQNYNLIQKLTTTAPEQTKNSNAIQMLEDSQYMDPSQFQGKWGKVALGNPELESHYATGVSTSVSRQQRRVEDTKPRNWNTGIAKEYTKNLLVPVNLQTARWAGFAGVGGLEQAKRSIPSKLQQKYNSAIVREVDQWVAKNSSGGHQVSDGEIRNYIDSLWYNGMEDRANSDINKLQEQRGRFDDIVAPLRSNGGSTSSYKPTSHSNVQASQSKPKTTTVYSAPQHQNVYDWAVNPSRFEEESKLYDQKRGKIYDYLVNNLKTHNKLPLLDKIYEKTSAINILQNLKGKGYPTFLGTPTGDKNNGGNKPK